MIKKLFVRKAFVIFGIISLAVLGFGAFVWAEGGVITVCVTDTGLLRLIDSEPGIQAANCKKTLSWNIQGEKGDKGDTGPQARVLDASGTEIGILIGYPQLPGTNQRVMEVYMPAYNVVGRFDRYTGAGYPPIHDVGYTDPYCETQAYMRDLTTPYLFAQAQSGDEYVGNELIGTVTNIQIKSWRSTSGACVDNRNDVWTIATAVDPVVLPYRSPFRVEMR